VLWKYGKKPAEDAKDIEVPNPFGTQVTSEHADKPLSEQWAGGSERWRIQRLVRLPLTGGGELEKCPQRNFVKFEVACRIWLAGRGLSQISCPLESQTGGTPSFPTLCLEHQEV
jgi:hypothetical protein